MKTQLRLSSAVAYGVGSGPESGAIDLIYSYLLHKFEQNCYSGILINQIGDDLQEFVMKQPGKQIYVNIRYPTTQDVDGKTVGEKNRIRLDIIHTGLIRIADKYKKLDKNKLEAIKSEILERDFSFEIVCKSFPHNKNKDLLAKIVVHPEVDKFVYYLLIEDKTVITCRTCIYMGGPHTFYYADLFSQGKWFGEDKFIITGKRKEVEIQILIPECKAEFKNLTKYDKPPFFEMMRADISKLQKDKAYQDWMHSLPPGMAGMLNYEPS